MKYFFSAGEHSGDMHAADLIRAVKKKDPQAKIWGMGGPLMAKAGAEILIDPTIESTIGFLEAGKKLFRFKKYLNQLSRFLRENQPDVLVWVDFGGFNRLLAEKAASLSIPVVCIFPPSAWAYGKGRAAKLSKCVTHLASVLPFEADFYRNYGVKVTYVGHPLVDRVKPEIDPDLWRRSQGVAEGEKVILLMPGSREQEVETLLPLMLEAVAKVASEQDGLRFYLPVAPTINRDQIRSYLYDYPGLVKTVGSEEVYTLMASADFGIFASGTATLEAALLGLPVIVIYRLTKLSAFIFRLLANKEQKEKKVIVALPNLVKGRGVVPELIQDDLTVEALASKFRDLLEKKEFTKEISRELLQIPELLGPPGVMERVATIVVGEAAH